MKGPLWSKEEKEFLKLHYNDGSNKYLQTLMNRPWGGIQVQAVKMGLKKYSKSVEIGKKYNSLLVIKEIESRKYKNGSVKRFECLCDCGNITNTFGTSIKSGHAKSCGCLNFINVRKAHLKNPGDISFNSIFKTYRINASDRKLSFNITIDDCKRIIINPCIYCGAEPIPYNYYINSDGSMRQGVLTKYQETIDRSWIYITGLDRIDSNKGYESDNLVPCCGICNTMKWDTTTEQFLNHIKKLYNFNFVEDNTE
jgi:hypothetical protein